jgi:hypothetical protein
MNGSFLVEDVQIYAVDCSFGCRPLGVHSAVLTEASPVFASMLRCGMSEDLTRRIDVRGVDRVEFEEFYRFLIPGSVEEVTEMNVEYVFYLADFFQVGPLRAECERVLERLPVSAKLLCMASRFGLPQLYSRCVADLTDPEEVLDLRDPLLVAHPDVLRVLRQRNRDPDLVVPDSKRRRVA